MSTNGKLNFLPITSICLVSFSLETSHKTLKVAAAKKSFPSVYVIDTTCFDEGFLFHVITGRHYFLNKFIVTQRFGETASYCVLRNKCFERSPYFISVISTVTLQCCQYQRFTTKFLLLKFINSVFLLFQFLNVSHFPS